MKNDRQLAQRDAKRDLGSELLRSVREMKAHKGKVVAVVQQHKKAPTK